MVQTAIKVFFIFYFFQKEKSNIYILSKENTYFQVFSSCGFSVVGNHFEMKGSMFSLNSSLYGLRELRKKQGHLWWILTLRGMETSFQPSTNESQSGNSNNFLVNHHLSRTQWNCPRQPPPHSMGKEVAVVNSSPFLEH